ncbi:MAG: hypothetical protein JWP97_5519 [Labilithrix sp.]|nr:hypothetical protein [Labilithrix sp.]
MNERKGPLESRPWPTQLEAHAVTPGPAPRLMGYEVEGDLVPAGYRFSDLLLLSLTGELPHAGASRAFEIALGFLLPLSVAHAPIHAAVLAQHCGARPSGLLSAASLALGEDALGSIAAARELLDAPSLPDVLPEGLRAGDDEERASVARLAALVGEHLAVPLLGRDPSRIVALLAVLRACGLESDLQLASAVTLARMPSALAEARPRRPLAFETYPTLTPPILYEP